MKTYNRIAIPADTEQPLPVEFFMAHGYPGKNLTGIVAYDDLFALINNTGKAMQPFVLRELDPKVADDELVTIRVPARCVRHLMRVFKNVQY